MFIYIIESMELIWDEKKRRATFDNRGLDFAEAGEVINSRSVTVADTRMDYGETLFITVGFLRKRMVVVVWSRRGETQRIISMRKANEREIAKYRSELG